MKNTLLTFLLVVPFLLASSCASPAVATDMIPTSIAVQNKHPYTVSTSVVGGSDTSSMGASKISGAAFHQALDGAIAQSGVFAAVAPESEADYSLRVILTNLDQPMAGFDMTVSLLAQWRLMRASDSAVQWEDYVSSQHTATVGEAFSGLKRLRLANEGAARRNIAEGLRCVSLLDLSANTPTPLP